MELENELKQSLNGIPKYINEIINIDYLVECTKGGSIRLPRGINRKERRMFVKFASNVIRNK